MKTNTILVIFVRIRFVFIPTRGQDEEGRNAREKSGIRRDAWAKRCEIDVGEIVCVRI
jgi:hypothetical protein